MTVLRPRLVWFAAILLSCLLAHQTLAAVAGKCDHCGHQLGKRYLTVGDAAYCSRQCHRRSLPRCAVCDQILDKSFLQADNAAYCSRQCYLSTLAKCAVCAKPLEGGHLSSGDQQFCSRQCFLTTQPKCEICAQNVQHRLVINGHVYCLEHGNGPRCSSCRLPFGAGTELADGRHLCSACNKDAVLEHARGTILYHRAQTVLHAITGWRSASLPELVLANLHDIASVGPDTAPEDIALRRGLYHRETTTVTRRTLLGSTKRTSVKEKIYILYGLNQQNFLATAVHELMHDMVAEQMTAIGAAPDWVEEGLCQYMAGLACQRLGLTAAAAVIDNCPDPVYGDGYRWYVRRFGSNNWPAVNRWIARPPDKFPAAAPKQ